MYSVRTTGSGDAGMFVTVASQSELTPLVVTDNTSIGVETRSTGGQAGGESDLEVFVPRCAFVPATAASRSESEEGGKTAARRRGAVETNAETRVCSVLVASHHPP